MVGKKYSLFLPGMSRQILRQLYLTILTIVSWFAILTQFYLVILNRTADLSTTIITYFSYFTILTNSLVAICTASILLKSNIRLGKFFSKTTNLTAITVYIIVVGAVYNLILRSLWHPTGLQQLTDELLHSAIPILFTLFWLIFVPKNELKWENAFRWLMYPLVYLMYILCRGAITDLYPYPFVDVNQLGYSKVLINSGGLAGVFLILSLLMILIGKWQYKLTDY